MHYPWWYVPVITAPMLIAFIAVVHILVSHYAVGGGILIALENSRAIRRNDTKYRAYWKKHAQFFVLLTVAFGAITGVGIWWTIALASPLATETLIQTFVFGWAIEWVFFIVEIVAGFAMYYYWDRLPPKTHRIIVWIYALAAWISLVLITGITAFMLNSQGLFANWSETHNFWDAFFNVQFLPQTLVRTGGCLLLAALYVYMHACWTLQKEEDAELREQVVGRMSKPLLFGLVVLLVGIGLWWCNLPPAALLAMQRAAALNIFLAMLFGIGAILVLLILWGPVRNPKSMNLGFAFALFFFGMTTFSIGEFVREAVRKPFIVDQLVLGNQILLSEVNKGREEGGYLESGLWTSRFARKFYPAPIKEVTQTVDAEGFVHESYIIKPVCNILTLEKQDRLELGKALFMYHCNDCHADELGYSSVGPLLVGESAESIAAKIRRLNEPVFNMPPWCGTDEESQVLAEYLETIRPERPPM
ncbi:MAG: cytochrome ubiquinol oxidase subunit I [Thermoguttaceae bacterium]